MTGLALIANILLMSQSLRHLTLHSAMPNRGYETSVAQAPAKDQNGLLSAISSCNLTNIRTAIALTANVNQSIDGEFPLRLAVILVGMGKLERSAVNLLLDAGADPNLHGQKTPSLIFSSKRGDYETVLLLLRYGADPATVGQDGETLFHLLATHDDAVNYGKLIAKPGMNLSARTLSEGRLPIHLAAMSGAFRNAALLVSYGQTTDAMDAGGNTPLHLAAEYNQQVVAEYLLAAGANVLLTNNRRQTAVHVAAEMESISVVRALSASPKFAEAAIMRNDRGQSALHLAAMGTSADLVKSFRSVQHDCEYASSAGRSPLHIAARLGSREVFGQLTEGSRLDTLPDLSGHTALGYFAARDVLTVKSAAGELPPPPLAGPAIWITADDLGVPPSNVALAVWQDGWGCIARDNSRRLELFRLEQSDASAIILDLMDLGYGTSSVHDVAMHASATVFGLNRNGEQGVLSWDWRLPSRNNMDWICQPQPLFVKSWDRGWRAAMKLVHATNEMECQREYCETFRGVAASSLVLDAR